MALMEAHRAELRHLTGLAENDLALIWRDLVDADAVVVRDGLANVLPDLVSMYGSAASTLGADWYDEMRAAEAIEGRFAAIAAELPDLARIDALAGWAVGPLFQAEPDPVTALSNVAGGLDRIIRNADRHSVMQSSVADPHARGWKRVGAGECGFCSMLIGRGAVYVEATAAFRSHDRCRCSSKPVWS